MCEQGRCTCQCHVCVWGGIACVLCVLCMWYVCNMDVIYVNAFECLCVYYVYICVFMYMCVYMMCMCVSPMV